MKQEQKQEQEIEKMQTVQIQDSTMQETGIREMGIQEAVQQSGIRFVDVRTPLEYAQDHIPGAINIPLLDNEERAVIGTLYKQEGKTQAVRRGLGLVTPKLQDLYEAFLKESREHQEVVIYCYRGGMRSGSITHYLAATGISNLLRLEGGYKSYRRYVINQLDFPEKTPEFVVLHGHTGVGKTQLLQELQKKGAAIVDLEELAKHSGSAFGSLFFREDPPTQKMFESLLVDRLQQAKKNQQPWIFMESESKKIGHKTVPPGFWEKMLQGCHVLVEASLEKRVERLVDDYTNRAWETDEQLEKSIHCLLRELGRSNIQQLHEWRKDRKYEEIARFLILHYYDPLYQHSIKQYKYDFKVCSDDILQATFKIGAEFMGKEQE